MNRRSILKTLGTTAIAAVALPTWAKGWTKEGLPSTNFFSVNEQSLTQLLVEAIIPETDTPGAASLGVDKFIALMLKDCHSQEDQTAFKKGLVEIESVAKETFDKPFANCSMAQKQHLIEGLAVYDDSELKKFGGLLKYLTIRGFKHSEYYYTATGFEFAPGKYVGCVELNEGGQE
ncbi:Gluconate 2-dehydrogenase subunit 3 [Spirosomataceae bacterium TFI 002]|nr:Gluconate 2-dehydrogenase subunit 3 [Spirosomataceae bacterium TFI 002]